MKRKIKSVSSMDGNALPYITTRLQAVYDKAEEKGIAECADFLACIDAFLGAAQYPLTIEWEETGRKLVAGDHIFLYPPEDLSEIKDAPAEHTFAGVDKKGKGIFVAHTDHSLRFWSFEPNDYAVREPDGSWVSVTGYEETP